MSEKPIATQEVFQLGNVSGGLQQGSISFKTIGIESDRWVTVKDGGSIVVVDLQQRQDQRLPMKEVDAAAMNPASKVLALRSGNAIQIYNLDMQARVKSTTMTEAVDYWRWISASQMAIVTTSAVYHWSMESTSEPVKMFDREAALSGCQILAYRTDRDLKWLAVLAIGRNDDGTVGGKAQLWSVEKGASKVIEGHQACFSMVPGPDGRQCNVLCVASNGAQGGRLMIMELPTGAKTDVTFDRKMLQVNFPNAQDFPVGMKVSQKYGLLFMMTRCGFLFIYDIVSGALIYQEQVTQSVVFNSVESLRTGGLVSVGASGSVFQVSINDNVIVRYIQQTLGNNDLALRVAASAGLAGGEELFRNKLRERLASQDIEGAVRVVAEAPNNVLRNRETIQIFSQLGAQYPHIQPPPISTYYKQLLAMGKLNALESVEFAKVVLARQNGATYFKQYIDDDKVEGSEELGDILMQGDQEMALKMYYKGGCHVKVISVLVSRGDFSKVMAYCQRVNYTPDWKSLLGNCVRTNPDIAVQMGIMIHGLPDHGHVDPNEVVELFLRGQQLRQLTLYLVDILKGDRPEDAALQTRLLDINLKHSPPAVAEQIFSQNIISHFEALPIAQQCEKAGLFQRALENYNRAQIQNNYQVSHLKDMKRCVANLQNINGEWLVEFFGTLSKDDSLEILSELMAANPRANLKPCVQIAAKYYEMLGTTTLIDLFLKYKSYEALYYFLGMILTFSTDPEVHFRYIEAAARVNQLQEVERVTRESAYYDPERTKNFLKEQKLPDLWPLINVCEQHNYHQEMVKYLFDTQNTRYIEMYVQKRNPSKTPFVIGALMDCNCQEEYISSILASVGSMCPADALVEEVEKRHRLPFLQQWLETRVQEKSSEQAVYNALAKIYVDSGKAQEFLEKNDKYDFHVVGKYCENRDPKLAIIAYQRGQCDAELVSVCIKNGMFKQLSRYLVKRQDLALWGEVLAMEDRKMLVDAVVQTALPETKVPEEVSTTVKAFMQADLPHELTVLLEKIVLHGSSEFKQNRYLQNLLILTAVKAAKDKVMDYVTRLDNYDAVDVANIATGAQLHEVAFAVYKKWKLPKEAMKVLIDDIKSIDRATEFAEKTNTADVWSLLGRALLEEGKSTEAVDALVKAKDPNFVDDVANACDRTGKFNDLVKYLHMARVEAKQKDPRTETMLILALAKVGKLVELDEFVRSTHTANVAEVADRCYNDQMYDAARILYAVGSNFPRLATTLVRLGNYHGAVEAAQKASNVGVWKEINAACVEAKEYKLAQVCALQIVTHADELEALIHSYERRGLWEEAIAFLKAALGSTNAHMGIFTELGVMYAKYKPEKLMEHIKMFHKRMNTHKMIGTATRLMLMQEVRYLYQINEEWDSAASTMMECPTSWEHEAFKDVMKNVGSLDVVYQGVRTYLTEHPELLNDLLTSIVARLDFERVVQCVGDDVFLIKSFLASVQSKNLRGVNDALNELYIEEEDYDSLRTSIEHYHNIDTLALAQRLEKHDLLELRRTAATLFRINGRYKYAVEIQKGDKMYQDAMETAAQSEDRELIEQLLRWFVAQRLPECFCACLYACYDFIQPDVALELAWRYNMQDCAMPFLIQVMRDYSDKISTLTHQLHEAKETAQEAAAAVAQTTAPPPAMITNNTAAYVDPNQGYGGYGQQQQQYGQTNYY